MKMTTATPRAAAADWAFACGGFPAAETRELRALRVRRPIGIGLSLFRQSSLKQNAPPQ